MGAGVTSLSHDTLDGLCLHLLVESLSSSKLSLSFFCDLSLFLSDLCGEHLLPPAEVPLPLSPLLTEEFLLVVDPLISLPEDRLLVDLPLILFILFGDRLLVEDPLLS